MVIEQMKDVAGSIAQTLDYAKKFHGRTFVIKFSGEISADDGVMDSIISDLVTLKYDGEINVVIVHGAGKRISSMMDEFDLTAKFIDGLRVTDSRTLDIVQAVMSDINNKIVWRIIHKGGRAVGFSGVSDNLFVTRQMSSDLGMVGSIERINDELVTFFTRSGYIPVIYPIGSDEQGMILNINADHVASELASAMAAEKLILLTDVKGVMRDPSDESTLISTLTLSEAKNILKEDFIKKGMKPKIQSCINALEHGVKSAHIVGLKNHAILHEIFTESGAGTVITG